MQSAEHGTRTRKTGRSPAGLLGLVILYVAGFPLLMFLDGLPAGLELVLEAFYAPLRWLGDWDPFERLVGPILSRWGMNG